MLLNVVTSTIFCFSLSMKVALITGITGQDGSYLSEFLLNMGYKVHGIVRRSSAFNTSRIDHILSKIELHYGDLVDTCNLISIISTVQPDEIYNLAAQSHVKVSFEMPEYTSDVDAFGAMRILEAIKVCGLQTKTRFYQASTSEMFGKVLQSPQTENTPFYPRSPYGIAKVFAHWTVINQREAFGLFAVNGVLFNHESPRRGGTFVTKKIANGIAQILAGSQDRIILGNLDAKRDWGHAKDYVRAMWMMLQTGFPEDYIICSGTQISVREFATRAFSYVGISIQWKGTGIEEVGISEGRVLVSVDSKYFRPCEVTSLLGSAAKAERQLGWIPAMTVDDLIEDMMKYELRTLGLSPTTVLKEGERSPDELLGA